MGEKGCRYIITTTESVYVSPTLHVNKDKNEVSILDISSGVDGVCRVLDISSIVGLTKEVYTQEDIYNTFMGMYENELIAWI